MRREVSMGTEEFLRKEVFRQPSKRTATVATGVIAQTGVGNYLNQKAYFREKCSSFNVVEKHNVEKFALTTVKKSKYCVQKTLPSNKYLKKCCKKLAD